MKEEKIREDWMQSDLGRISDPVQAEVALLKHLSLNLASKNKFQSLTTHHYEPADHRNSSSSAAR